MSGFSLRFTASRVSLSALVFVVLTLVGAIGLVAIESGLQFAPRSDGTEALAPSARPDVIPQGMT
jgi:hypothetical protein